MYMYNVMYIAYIAPKCIYASYNSHTDSQTDRQPQAHQYGCGGRRMPASDVGGDEGAPGLVQCRKGAGLGC